MLLDRRWSDELARYGFAARPRGAAAGAELVPRTIGPGRRSLARSTNRINKARNKDTYYTLLICVWTCDISCATYEILHSEDVHARLRWSYRWRRAEQSVSAELLGARSDSRYSSWRAGVSARTETACLEKNDDRARTVLGPSAHGLTPCGSTPRRRMSAPILSSPVPVPSVARGALHLAESC